MAELYPIRRVRRPLVPVQADQRLLQERDELVLQVSALTSEKARLVEENARLVAELAAKGAKGPEEF